MKCPIRNIECNKIKVYNVTNINKENVETFNLCEDCIAEVVFESIEKEDEQEIEMIESNENEKVESGIKLMAQSQEMVLFEQSCPFCKITLKELINKSRMGCAKCYEVFNYQISNAIDQIQKNTSGKKLNHTGKTPTKWKEKQIKKIDYDQFLQDLKKEQELSIKEENYELASELKSKIIGFEFLLNQYKILKSEPEQEELIKNQIFEFIFLHKMKLKE